MRLVHLYRNQLLAIFSIVLLLAIWYGVALALAKPTLPSPAHVAEVFWHATVSGELPYHLGATLLRLIVSFSLAMLLGCAIGIILGKNKTLDAFF